MHYERAPCFGRSKQDVFEGKAREICGPGGKILIPPIKSMRFLSLDGAGMRGLYTASCLSWLVEGFAKKRGVPDLDPGKAFDLIAGTSTGANCRLCHLEWDLLGYRCKALSIRGQGHLPPHERCGNEITATMLSAGAPLPDQLRSHLNMARSSGAEQVRSRSQVWRKDCCARRVSSD